MGYVARSHCDQGTGTVANDEAALLVDGDGLAHQWGDTRLQQDCDLPADRDARLAVELAYVVPAPVKAVQGQEGLHQQLGARDGATGRRAEVRRGQGFRGLGFRGLGFRGLGFRGLGFRGLGFRAGSRGPVDVDAGADHEPPIPGRLGQDARQLAVAEEQVVRPLELDLDPGNDPRPLGQGQGHGGEGEVAPGDREAVITGTKQHREQERLPGG